MTQAYEEMFDLDDLSEIEYISEEEDISEQEMFELERMEEMRHWAEMELEELQRLRRKTVSVVKTMGLYWRACEILDRIWDQIPEHLIERVMRVMRAMENAQSESMRVDWIFSNEEIAEFKFGWIESLERFLLEDLSDEARQRQEMTLTFYPA